MAPDSIFLIALTCIMLMLLVVMSVSWYFRQRKAHGLDTERELSADTEKGQRPTALESKKLPKINESCASGSDSEVEGQKFSILSDEEDGEVSKPCPHGRIKFKLDYDFLGNMLSVTVMQVDHVPIGPSQFFVKVYLIPDKKKEYCTKTQKKTAAPVFDETFLFKVPKRYLHNKTLVLELHDSENENEENILGKVVIPLNTTDFRPKLYEVWRNIEVEDSADSLGELCVSMWWNRMTHNMTVSVLEAKNLSFSGNIPDFYVKLELFHGIKRLRKYKTMIVKGSNSPKFNEDFHLSMAPGILKRAYVRLSVWQHDLLIRNSLIGWCMSGPLTLGFPGIGPDGAKHWEQVVEGQKPVAQWYQLQVFQAQKDEKERQEEKLGKEKQQENPEKWRNEKAQNPTEQALAESKTTEKPKTGVLSEVKNEIKIREGLSMEKQIQNEEKQISRSTTRAVVETKNTENFVENQQREPIAIE